MAVLNVQKLPSINDGMQLTFVGDPGICTYWEIDAGGVGTLSDTILVTDGDGVAVREGT